MRLDIKHFGLGQTRREPAHLGFQDPRLEFLVGMTRLAKYVLSLRFRDQLFENLLGLCINLQNALPGPPL